MDLDGAAEARYWESGRYENKQLVHRHPVEFVRRVLIDFNSGSLDAATAASHLGVSRSRLYELRTVLLSKRVGFAPKASGGDRHKGWPPEAHRFLLKFLPLQNPPNYQLVADELKRLCGVVRARSSVEAHVKAHYAHFVPTPQRKPRVYRRFRRARIGELWQHDSSIHQWWPAPAKQTLLLTIDAHSGRRGERGQSRVSQQILTGDAGARAAQQTPLSPRRRSPF